MPLHMNNIPQFIIKIYFIFFRIYLKIENFLIPYYKEEHKNKVFCVGSWKTGTSSLNKALSILGYRTVKLINYLQRKNESWVELIKRCNYDAFSDYPISYIFKELDESFPGSKFILTVRDTEAFAKSYMNYFKGTYLEKTPEEMEEAKKKYENHIKEVKEHFKNRPDQLLVMNITAGEGWEKLCEFLDKPTPDKEFPCKNKGRYKKK